MDAPRQSSPLLVALALTGACAHSEATDEHTHAVDAAVQTPSPDAPGSEPTRTIEFTFDTGLDGWKLANGTKQYDHAELDTANGAPPSCVLLDGSDLGTPDAAPNAWMSRVIAIPASAKTLRFETRAQNNGALRVRLVDAGSQSHTLLGYEVVSGSTWVMRSAPVTPYAGMTVTLFFEQNDNDIGQGEHRYIDNIRIE